MNLADITPMNKTQMNMYSTLAPGGRTLGRPEFPTASRSSRYRFNNSTKPFNPQITNLSCTISKQHRTQNKIGTLPNIKRQKGFMLQEWLNDALQGQQGMGIKQPLKTLKNYEMDKGSLRNANLSLEQINNLYSGLFVYTSGIKNAFQEMLKGASSHDSRLEKTYWKIFIKLLENTIPVKTCFQIIEDEYRREIVNLKNNIIEQHKKEEKIHEDYEQKIKKLKREIDDCHKKFSQNEQQYKVMNANLIMYEQTFNEQVSLRLKFQQKINQVYTSYGELKQKYESVKVQLNYKNHQLVQAQTRISQLQCEVQNQQIKNDDVIQRLRRAQEKLLEKEEELVVKNQEINDIRVQSQTEEEKKKSEEIALDQLISTNKLLKKREAQHLKKAQKLMGVIEVQQKTMAKLKETLLTSRQKNDEMFLKHRQSILKNTQIQQSKAKVCFELQTAKSMITTTQNKLSIAKAQKEELSSKVSKLQLQCQFKNKQILDKSKTIQIFGTNIAELKSTKDKYQRLNSHLRIQIQKNKEQIGTKTKELNTQMGKVFDLSYQLEKEKNCNIQHITTIQVLKETLESKDRDINDQNKVFKNKLLELQKKIKEKQDELYEKNKQILKMRSEMGKKDAQKLERFQELAYLHTHNTQLLKQIKQTKDKLSQVLKDHQCNILQLASLQKKLQSKEFTLDKKKNQINSQITNLRESLLKSKCAIQTRKQYIHPMVLEDYASKIIRYQQKIKQIKHSYQHNNSIHDSLVSQLFRTKQEKEALLEEKAKMTQNYQMLMKDSAKRQEQKRILRNQLQGKIKQKEVEISNLNENAKIESENNKMKIHEFTTKLQQSLKTNSKLLMEIKNYQQLQAKRRNCKSVGTQYIPVLKLDVQIQTQVQTQNLPSNPPTLKKKMTSLRQSQHSLQRQQKGVQKAGQRLYDRIVDQRSIQSLKNERQIICEQQDNQRREERGERKIQGKQFKKALRMTFIRR